MLAGIDVTTVLQFVLDGAYFAGEEMSMKKWFLFFGMPRGPTH